MASLYLVHGKDRDMDGARREEWYGRYSIGFGWESPETSDLKKKYDFAGEESGDLSP